MSSGQGREQLPEQASKVGRSPRSAAAREAGQAAVPEQVLGAAGNDAVLQPSNLLYLQRAIGNGAVSDLLSRRPTTVQRAGEKATIDKRGSSWKKLDEQANQKRLAHAKEDYLFDKSLKAPGAGVTEENRKQNAQAAEKVKGRLGDQSEKVKSNDVPWPPSDFFFLKYQEDPDKAVQHFIKENKLDGTPNQVATIHARAKHKENIPKPETLLPPEAVKAHLGKFANGAHAFIDPNSSQKIEGEIEDIRWKGWGVDANFVAPLDEANALNAKAHRERGIETIEDELGIPKKYWSKSEWNPQKYLVRWIIPKPKLTADPKDEEIVLEMAKGTEWGADSALWVAGGLTKGGASEAVLKAIPREQLIKMLAKGTIKQVREYYPETRDHIE